MGLDVTSYRKLTKLDVVFDEDGEPIDPSTREPFGAYMRVYDNPDFPGRLGGLEPRGIYAYQDAEGFWSGGYGRYNHWREKLAQLAGYTAIEHTAFKGATPAMSYAAAAWASTEGAFWELINFSDCEGTIGPVVAVKLVADFAAFDEKAKAVGDEWFYEKYRQWHECFEMASDDGAVSFH